MFSMDNPGGGPVVSLKAVVVLYQKHENVRKNYANPTEEAIYHKKIALQRQF